MNELYEQWDEVLPTIPLDAILKAFSKEVLLANPNLKAMSSARDRAPRKRLNILEPLKAINKAPLPALAPLVQQVTRVLNDLLIQGSARICRFGTIVVPVPRTFSQTPNCQIPQILMNIWWMTRSGDLWPAISKPS
jgi:hypothetical protein